jgi:hypothetical protein
LKRFAKKTAPNTPKFVQVLLTKIKETSDMVNQKRENVKFNPGNLNSLVSFVISFFYIISNILLN